MIGGLFPRYAKAEGVNWGVNEGVGCWRWKIVWKSRNRPKPFWGDKAAPAVDVKVHQMVHNHMVNGIQSGGGDTYMI